jgi:hypothetical protein
LKRVLIVGAGYLGRRVFEWVRRSSNIQVEMTNRNSQAAGRVDFLQRHTFPTMTAFDVVVDCAEADCQARVEAAQYCLENKIDFIEPSSDSQVTHEFIAKFQQPVSDARILLGVGLFPGLSTLTAADAVKGQHGSVEVGVRLNPVSGAGRSTAKLMAALMLRDAKVYTNGQPQYIPAMTEAPRVIFPSGMCDALYVDLPDSEVIARLFNLARSSTVISFVPSGFTKTVAKLAQITHRMGAKEKQLVKALIALSGTLFRTYLLGSRPTRVEITASAHVNAENGTHASMVAVSDGMNAAALAIATALEIEWARSSANALVFLPDCTGLEEFIQLMRTHAKSELAIDGPHRIPV